MQDISISLPTLATVIITSVTWAGSVAGVYFGLRNRISAGEARMDRFKVDLDTGASRFTGFETRFNVVEKQQAHHSERIIVVETLLGAMDNKLDTIIKAVNHA